MNTYDALLRLDTRTATLKTPPEVQLWWMDLDYGAAAGVNRGDLTQQRMKAGSSSIITQTYEYDRLNRLTKVTDTGLPSPQEFLIDRWGNRAFKTGSYLAPGFPMTQVNAVMVATQTEADTKFPKNRISHQGADYDNAGNMTQLEGRPVAYDFEGRITKMTASTGSTSSEERLWFYDGEGRRVREEHWAVAGSARTLQWETVFVYDPLGALVAEYDTRSPGTAGIRYLTVDHLGSTRMVTKESGTTEAQVVDTRHDYLPFGEEVRSTGGPKEKFTGKERADVVGTRVDYFGARYMSAMLGRFTSPDVPLVDQRTEDPQSWNLYAYARNNPVAMFDPDGMKAVSTEECAIDPSCVSLPVNIVYDKGAAIWGKDGKLLPKYQQALDAQIEKAKSDYGEFNIHLAVGAPVEGKVTYNKQRDRPEISEGGLAGSLNIAVSDGEVLKSSGLHGKSGIVNGLASTFLNVENLLHDTLAHELSHHFSGDVNTRIPNLMVPGVNTAFAWIASLGLNTYTDWRNDWVRNSPGSIRPQSYPGFPANFGMFNRGARTMQGR